MNLKKAVIACMASPLMAKLKNPKGQLLSVDGILTQTFNAVKGKSSDLAVVYVSGFGSLPTAGRTGVVGEVAEKEGADFVRFNHPLLVTAPEKLSYAGMVRDVTAVVNALPHENVILVGSSFGAGLMPFVDSDKVKGVFGIAAAPASALLRLFERQAGWEAFETDKTKLEIHSPTLSKPFTMTWEQYEGVKDYSGKEAVLGKAKAAVTRDRIYTMESYHFSETIEVSPARPARNIQGVLLSGTQDPISKIMDAYNLAGALGKKVKPVSLPNHGHKLPERQITKHLTQLINQVRCA